MQKNILKLSLLSFIITLTSSCASTQVSTNPTSPSSPTIALWDGNSTEVWSKLQNTPPKDLRAMNPSDSTSAGWVKLAIISKRDSNNTRLLTLDLAAWRAEYPNHPGNALFPNNASLAQLATPHTPQHLAIMLPLSGPLGHQGNTVRDGFLKAYYANQTKTHTAQAISFYDTNINKNIDALYQKALADGADFIVGPLSKEEVQTLTRQNNFSMPTLALNYTDTTSSLPRNLYQFGLSPTDETQQVADKAKAAGLSHAVIITTQNEWGQRVAKSLTTRWQANGGKVQDVLYISPKTDMAAAIAGLMHVDIHINKKKTASADDRNLSLQKTKHRQDIDVVFLLTPPQTARSVVPLIKYYYIGRLPIYSTSVIYSGTASSQDTDLNNVIFCDAPSTMHGVNSNRLFAVGLDAYKVSNQLTRLTAMPNFPIYGATGALTLNSQNQIYRRLPWTTMHDGHP